MARTVTRFPRIDKGEATALESKTSRVATLAPAMVAISAPQASIELDPDDIDDSGH
jgi:hypothetical protein